MYTLQSTWPTNIHLQISSSSDIGKWKQYIQFSESKIINWSFSYINPINGLTEDFQILTPTTQVIPCDIITCLHGPSLQVIPCDIITCLHGPSLPSLLLRPSPFSSPGLFSVCFFFLFFVFCQISWFLVSRAINIPVIK